MNLLEHTPKGLYCPAADVYIDPCRKVDRAIITHGHADHVHAGLRSVLTSTSGTPIVHHRLHGRANIQSLPFGQSIKIGDAKISLHPAGHILGSAQVRIEVGGKIAVITGDYKRGSDPTCESFEPVPCHLLVTETTFGRPEFHWPDPQNLTRQLDDFWDRQQKQGTFGILLVYSLGKAQRVLSMLNPERGPILIHGAMIPFVSLYRKAGIPLPTTHTLKSTHLEAAKENGILLLPPGAYRAGLKKKLQAGKTALVSGWTLTGDTRQSIRADEGIPLSDHADWSEIQQTVHECQPEELWAMHGFREEVSRYYEEQGLRTRIV